MGIQDDRTRFATVVVPHLADAYAFARWLVGQRSDAEDIVQEACLRAYKAISTFSGSEGRPWLLAIVRNTAYSWLNKNRPAHVVAVDDLDEEERGQVERGDGAEATPEAALIAKADAARLRRAIEALPDPFREMVVLRDLQGLEYREIAAITAMPIGTVMSRLARARRRLIGMIGEPER